MQAVFSDSNSAIRSALESLNRNAQLSQNRQELFYMLRNMFNSRDEEKLKRAEALLDDSQQQADTITDFTGKHYLLQAQCLHALYKSNWTDAALHYRTLVKHWDDHPEWISADSITYKKMLSNFLSACHAVGDLETIPPLLQRIKSIPCQTAEEEAEQFQNIYFVELLHLINTDGFEKLPALEEQIIAGLKKYSTKINKAREQMFYYNLFIAYFCQNDWKNALDRINNIINAEKNDHRLDIQALSRLLRLVVYFELDYFDLLEYEMINVERYFRQRKIWYAYEAAVVRLLKKMIGKTAEEQVALFTSFINQLTVFETGRETPLPALSELKLWADSHIRDISIREVLRQENIK